MLDPIVLCVLLFAAYEAWQAWVARRQRLRIEELLEQLEVVRGRSYPPDDWLAHHFPVGCTVQHDGRRATVSGHVGGLLMLDTAYHRYQVHPHFVRFVRR